jgi:hypothetical protein
MMTKVELLNRATLNITQAIDSLKAAGWATDDIKTLLDIGCDVFAESGRLNIASLVEKTESKGAENV